MAGLLYGEGDFSKTVCIAANCGEDTDCTCATAGSIFGIMHGADAIPKKWITPIGRSIKTLCINMADFVAGGLTVPQTVDELTERTFILAQQVLLRNDSMLRLSETQDTTLVYDIPLWKGNRNFTHVKYIDMDLNGNEFSYKHLISSDQGANTYKCLTGPVYSNHQFSVAVDYLEDGSAFYGNEKKIKIKIHNHSRNLQEYLNLKWYLPDKLNISPTKCVKVFLTTPFLKRDTAELEFTFTALDMSSTYRAVLEITMDGRSYVQLTPVIFTRENVKRTEQNCYDNH